MIDKLLTVIAPPVPRTPRVELWLGAMLVGIAIKAFQNRTNPPFTSLDLKPEKFEPYWETLKK